MKNVTITLPDDLARRARVEAAKEGKSLSRFVSEMLAERSGRATSQRDALEKFLAAQDFPGVAANLPTREEIYAERLFHRHERAPLHKGPQNTVQTRKGARVAKRARK